MSTLDWIGFPLLELSRFLRALWAVCLKACATKSTRYTASDLTTLLGEGVRHHKPDDLFRHLLQICTYLEIRPSRVAEVGMSVARLNSPFMQTSDSPLIYPTLDYSSSWIFHFFRCNPPKHCDEILAQYRLGDTGPEFLRKAPVGEYCSTTGYFSFRIGIPAD